MSNIKLKVLWFANTPAAGVKNINLIALGGGWLAALDLEIQKLVDLHIVFNYPKPAHRFKHGNTWYYPVCPKNWRLKILRNNISSMVYGQEFESDYLNIIKEIKPDIIHIHGTENVYGCIIGKTTVPVTVSIQGNATIYAYKYFSGIGKEYLRLKSYSPGESLKDFLLSKTFKRGYDILKQLSLLELKTLSNCKYIIGRTEWDKRISSVLAPRSKYFHGDEILRETFYIKHWEVKDVNSKIVLHTTTSNSYYKGFETICRALNELNRLGLDIEWRVAGVRESDLIVKVVRRMLKERYPKTGLTLLGGLKEEALVDSLIKAHIYIMPSHIENSPNSLCEAMLLGMPCIATLAGGTGSLMKDGKEGLLIQEGDPWVLAGSIIELVNDWEKAKDFGRNARIRASQRHDKRGIVKDYINIYEKIVDENILLNKE